MLYNRPKVITGQKGITLCLSLIHIFVWQNTSLLRMLKKRSYIGDLVQGTFECEKIRSDKRVTDPTKWIITENHHEPVSYTHLDVYKRQG